MLNKSSDKRHFGLVPVLQSTLLEFLHSVPAAPMKGLVCHYTQAGSLSYLGVNPLTHLFLGLRCFLTHTQLFPVYFCIYWDYIHSFIRYLLSIDYILGTMLNTGCSDFCGLFLLILVSLYWTTHIFLWWAMLGNFSKLIFQGPVKWL